MGLMHPAALWLLLLLPVPWLLARRHPPRRLVVSAVSLWREARTTASDVPTYRRLRRSWLVILQTAFIAVLAATLARPIVGLRPSRVALIFDMSASMGTRAGATMRIDEARARAESTLAGLPRGTRVGLIAAGASPRNLGEHLREDGSLTRALSELVPTDGRADLEAAIDLVRLSYGDAPIYVFSDHAPVETASGTAHTLVWQRVGHAAENLAIVRLSARRLPFDPASGSVLVAVRNFGTTPHEVQIEIAQDGRAFASKTLKVAAGGEQTSLVDVSRIGGVISARLLGTDALEADNHRWTVVPSMEPLRVGLFEVRSAFLKKALAVNPAIALEEIARDSGGLPPDAHSGVWNRFDVVVCEGCADLPPAVSVLRVPPGTVAREAGPLTVSLPDHPVAAALDVGDVFASPVRTAASVPNEQVVLRAGGLPAVVAYERDGQRVVDFDVDLTAPEVTVSTAFPILVANAIDWLALRHENLSEVAPGQPLSWVLPEAAAAERASVTGPDGRLQRVQLAGRRLLVAGLERSGVYRVATPSSVRVFVVNPSVETESDITSSGEAAEAKPIVTTDRGPEQADLWRACLLIALLIFSVEWWFRRGRTPWRATIAALLTLSLAGLAMWNRESALVAVAVLDRLASVPAEAQERALARVSALAGTMRPDDKLGLVTFGADAAVDVRPSQRMRVPAVQPAVVQTRTNIAEALRLARALLPDRGARRLVLLSDGRENIGHAESEAAHAAADGIPIDVSTPNIQAVQRSPVVRRLVAPAERRVDEPFTLAVEMDGGPGRTGEVTVYRDEQVLASSAFTIGADGGASVAFMDRRGQPGTYTYRAFLKEPLDDFASQTGADADAGAVVSVSGVTTVLYVTGFRATLQSTLSAAGFRVVTVRPESMPAASAALGGYDAVVLDAVPAESLRPGQLSALAQDVEHDGGGLLLLGSSRTLDLAGYPAGPVGPLLPVDLRPRTGRQVPSLNLVLVFDKSGSMSDLANGVPQIELARQSVMRVLDVLRPSDALGVLAFDAQPVVVTPLGPGHDARAVSDRLRTIEPGGSTRIAPAVEQALQWLHSARGATRPREKILLLSDGMTSAADRERVLAVTAKEGVEISTVAIGPNADRALLQQIADSTGGKAYFPSNLADLPAVVGREATRSASGTVVEERFTLRAGPHQVLAGLDGSSLPQLGGYVVSAIKPTATSILMSHLDDPVLGAWRVGLGRVGVLTTDLQSDWSAGFRAWTGYARLWTQMLRWLARNSESSGVHLAITEYDGSMRVLIEARAPDGGFVSLSDVQATARIPSGESRQVAFVHSAPGQYEARMEMAAAGPYVVAVDTGDAGQVAAQHFVRGFYWTPTQERASKDTDVAFMSRLAQATGGRVLGQSDSPFNGPRPTEATDISTWCVGAALIMFILELAAGRGGLAKALRRI